MSQPERSPRFRDMVVVIGWVVVLATGLEFMALDFGRLVEGRLIFVPREAVWMIPMLHVGVGIALAAGLAVAGRIVSGRWAWRLLGFAAGAYVVLPPLLLYVSRLGLVSVGLLVAGVGATVSRVMAARGDAVLAALRRPGRVVLAVLVVVALGLPVAGWDADQSLAGGLAPRGDDRPNVLLIFLDTVRADHLSLYGHGRATSPNIDALARRGVAFDAAVSPAPWTLPAHAAALTGHWAFELSADWTTPLDDAQPTLAEVLSAAGYRTAGFVGNSRFLSYETGVDRGFQHYEDYPLTPKTALIATSLGRFLVGQARLRRFFGTAWTISSRTADEISERFLDWLDDEPAGQPFFAFLNYFDAHHPYAAPAPFAGRYGGPVTHPTAGRHLTSLFQPAPVFPETAAGLDSLARSYDEAIAFVDDELGRLFDRLERTGRLDNTIVIVTADHGEQFGEHGLVDHGNSLYYPLLHVPLVVAWGDRLDPVRVEVPVSTRDLPATILDLIGVGGDEARPLPGMSLRGLWSAADSASGRPPVLASVTGIAGKPPVQPISRGDMIAAVMHDSLLVIRDGRCALEIYDIEDDPVSVEALEGLGIAPVSSLAHALDSLAPSFDCR